jgi:hypothetical protein
MPVCSIFFTLSFKVATTLPDTPSLPKNKYNFSGFPLSCATSTVLLFSTLCKVISILHWDPKPKKLYDKSKSITTKDIGGPKGPSTTQPHKTTNKVDTILPASTSPPQRSAALEFSLPCPNMVRTISRRLAQCVVVISMSEAIAVASIPHKGRGYIAQRDIKQGEVILEEHALKSTAFPDRIPYSISQTHHLKGQLSIKLYRHLVHMTNWQKSC